VNRVIVTAIALVSIFLSGRLIVKSLDGSVNNYDNSQDVSFIMHSLSSSIKGSRHFDIVSSSKSSRNNPRETRENEDESTTSVYSDIPTECVGKEYPLSIVIASKLNDEYSKG
jgi:hypothetical protein